MRQAGLALGKSSYDIATYANRSMNFVNMWDANLTHDGFTGFAQRRYTVGTSLVGSRHYLPSPSRTERLPSVHQMHARPSIPYRILVLEALTTTLDSTNVRAIHS